ncbi:hypothetical protein [Mycetohabitans rhizoxinica]|uniref:hypothetical protein n=1 Tax=Mycetohabitans rhizoxinica TaxID=412963 RepID=UPI0030D5991C
MRLIEVSDDLIGLAHTIITLAKAGGTWPRITKIGTLASGVSVKTSKRNYFKLH